MKQTVNPSLIVISSNVPELITIVFFEILNRLTFHDVTLNLTVARWFCKDFSF